MLKFYYSNIIIQFFFFNPNETFIIDIGISKKKKNPKMRPNLSTTYLCSDFKTLKAS